MRIFIIRSLRNPDNLMQKQVKTVFTPEYRNRFELQKGRI